MTLSQTMRQDLGMTIAVWFPAQRPLDECLGFLRRTLDDVELFVQPANVVLVVDGCPHAVEPARQAAEEVRLRAGDSPQVAIKVQNEGQGGAVAFGLERLLELPQVRYLCARDADGDHDLYDLPPMYRRLRELEEEAGERTWVLGCRADLHRPMGYARGELEAVLNEVTVQALAVTACPARLSACKVYEGYPDFQSGYKLYNRWSAQVTAQSLRAAAAREPEKLPLRWGVQFISTVELLREGGVPGAVQRLCYDEQPLSTFEGYDDLSRAFGCQIAWLFRRLQIAPETGLAVLDNALSGTLLATTHGGWEVICRLRDFVAEDAWGAEPPAALRRGGMF